LAPGPDNIDFWQEHIYFGPLAGTQNVKKLIISAKIVKRTNLDTKTNGIALWQ